MLEVGLGSSLLLGSEGYWIKSSSLLWGNDAARHRGRPPGMETGLWGLMGTVLWSCKILGLEKYAWDFVSI